MILSCQNLSKAFGSDDIIKNVSFQINEGDKVAIVGNNGAGKSTLMKILTGVYTKDAGQVIVDGKEVCYNNPQEAEKAGIVFKADIN